MRKNGISIQGYSGGLESRGGCFEDCSVWEQGSYLPPESLTLRWVKHSNDFMCYLTGRKISNTEFQELLELNERLGFLSEELAIYKGFDYNSYPVIRAVAGKHQTEKVRMQWGFLPPYLKTKEDARRFRFGYKDESGKYHKPY